jgi:hypothetical protein
MAARLCARMSTSTPTTMPSPFSRCSSDALRISDPPCAIPVSTIARGFTLHTSSCSAITSAGSWMIGLPSQVKLYV